MDEVYFRLRLTIAAGLWIAVCGRPSYRAMGPSWDDVCVVSRAGRIEQVERLRSARDLIDRAFCEPLDVRRLASHAGYSRFHFIRAFGATYGETPAQYVARRRMERAQDLLALANLTVGEVGELVGFSSLPAFSRRFKAHVGVAPSEFRRRMVERGGPPPMPGYVLMWWRRHPGSRRAQF